jgi:hypothetical protein
MNASSPIHMSDQARVSPMQETINKNMSGSFFKIKALIPELRSIYSVNRSCPHRNHTITLKVMPMMSGQDPISDDNATSGIDSLNKVSSMIEYHHYVRLRLD